VNGRYQEWRRLVHKTDGTIVKMQEPYIKEPFYSITIPRIPADEYFVMGDTVITAAIRWRLVRFA